MDILSLRDIVLVGIPEQLMSLLFALFLVKGSYLSKNKAKSFLLLILSAFLIQYFIIVSRANFSNRIITSFISVLAYIIALKTCYKFRLWTSFLSAFLIILLLLFFDIFLVAPFANYLQTTGSEFYESRLILSIPARIAHIFILFLQSKFKITIEGTLLEKSWKELSSSIKSIIAQWFAFLTLSILVITNYIEFFKNSMIKDLDVISLFGVNVKIFYITTVLILIFVFLISKKIHAYIKIKDQNDEIKHAIDRDPIELLFIILNIIAKNSSQTQRENLTNQIVKFLNSKGGEQSDEHDENVTT